MSPLKTLREHVFCFWMNDRNEWNRSMDTTEKLWWKPQIGDPAKLYFSRAVFLGKRDFFWKAYVYVCVGERGREGSWGELFGSIAQYFPLAIKCKLYTTPQIIPKMSDTSRVFCYPLDEQSLLGRCWSMAKFFKGTCWLFKGSQGSLNGN